MMAKIAHWINERTIPITTVVSTMTAGTALSMALTEGPTVTGYIVGGMSLACAATAAFVIALPVARRILTRAVIGRQPVRIHRTPAEREYDQLIADLHRDVLDMPGILVDPLTDARLAMYDVAGVVVLAVIEPGRVDEALTNRVYFLGVQQRSFRGPLRCRIETLTTRTDSDEEPEPRLSATEVLDIDEARGLLKRLRSGVYDERFNAPDTDL